MGSLFPRHPIRYLDPSGQQGVFDPDTFRFVLRRERERADRVGRQFSLIVFRLPVRRTKSSDRWLLNSVAEKIRISDSIGWLDSVSLGILLPDTSADGAASLLQEMAPACSNTEAVPGIRVHTYPDPPKPDQPREKPLANGRLVEFVPESPEDSSLFFSGIFAVSPGVIWRWGERAVAGVMLVVLSPLFLLFAIIIKISSPGPVLFSQERIGQKGKTFKCYKFRTMHPQSETQKHEEYLSYLMTNSVPMQKLDSQGDSRIFRAGRLLRSSSLDELPQLINIFKGEMRLVGPRPSTAYEFAQFLPWQRHRVDVVPGLTGLWQVSGKNKTTFAEMIRLDLRYIRERSPLMDLGIILKTVPVVIVLFLEEHFGLGIAERSADSVSAPGAMRCFRKTNGKSG